VALLPSKFGWILSGNKTGTTVNHASVNYFHNREGFTPSDNDMRHFWDLEALGISENQKRSLTTKDAAILCNFHDTLPLEDGRRIVSLPRKEYVILSSNFNNAETRFHTLQRRFNDDAQFREMYYSQMLGYIRKGHVETVASEYTNSTYYLPHHAVVGST
jgi:hypothetical protein